MALVEDLLKSNLPAAVALSASALLLPKLLPDLSPQLRAAIKGAFSLFLESESDAEGGIIERLAENVLQNVLDNLAGSRSPGDQRHAAREAVATFKRTARYRARRYGRDEKDRSVRYHRHLLALRRRLERARARCAGNEAATLQELAAMLDNA